MKWYIQGQAKSSKDIENTLKDHITEIELNFIMLVLGPGVSTRHHWKQEVYAQIHDVPVTKKSKQYPTEAQLYKWLYTDNIPDFQEPKKFRKLLKAISDKEKQLPKPGDAEALQKQVIEYLHEYFTWLAAALSEDGYVTLSEVEEALTHILESGENTMKKYIKSDSLDDPRVWTKAQRAKLIDLIDKYYDDDSKYEYVEEVLEEVSGLDFDELDDNDYGTGEGFYKHFTSEQLAEAFKKLRSAYGSIDGCSSVTAASASNVEARVQEYVEGVLHDALENLENTDLTANVVQQKVGGYNSDWCNEEALPSGTMAKFDKAVKALAKLYAETLFWNEP